MSMYIIAEIGINHNGSLDLARELIRRAAQAGCNAVKFQKRTIDLVYTAEELDKYRESPWGTTNRQQKEGLEFSVEQYQNIEEYTRSLDMDFIVSCWDKNSVDVIEEHCNVRYHKVASALATDKAFLQKLNETGKPVILSVGMCTPEEVDAAINILDNVEYVLACTSTYPTKPEEVNLRYINTLQESYPDLRVGLITITDWMHVLVQPPSAQNVWSFTLHWIEQCMALISPPLLRMSTAWWMLLIRW